MYKLSLRNLWSHKTRLIASVLAVVLGVSFLVGALVLTDTIKKTFSDLFSDVYKGTDAVVRAKSAFTTNQATSDGRKRVDNQVVLDVQAIPGVKAAEGSITGYAQGIDPKTNKLMGSANAPSFGFAWGSVDQLNPYKLRAGRAPAAAGEVVVGAGLFKKNKLKLDEKFNVLTAKGAAPYSIVGWATFGASDSAAGSSAILFLPTEAQRVLAETGKFDSVNVVAQPGTSQQQLQTKLQATLPKTLETLTGAEITAEQQKQINDGFLNGFSIFLSSFAWIAVLVGSFVIYNAFAIVVAQRNRENALLRAIGASKQQVIRAQFLESVIVAVVSSVLGIIVGIVLAVLLKGLLKVIGFDLPSSGLTLRPARAVLGLVVGIVVTLLSSLVPAIRAGRVPPLAALRNEAVDRSATSRGRVVAGVVLLATSAAFMVAGQVIKGTGGVLFIGLSFVSLLVGLIIIGPVLARPLARILGSQVSGLLILILSALLGVGALATVVLGAIKVAPASVILGLLLGGFAYALARAGLSAQGTTGRLARENASRNPARTSTTAFALTVGVAVVAAIMTFAFSLVNTITGAFKDNVQAKYLVTSSTFFGFPQTVADSVAKVPGVTTVSRVKVGQVRIDGKSHGLTAIDVEKIKGLFTLGNVKGDLSSLVGANNIAIADNSMKANKWTRGQKITLLFSNGDKVPFTIAATYSEPGAVQNSYYITDSSTFDKYIPGQFDQFLYVGIQKGTDTKAFVKAAEASIANVPSAKVQTNKQFQSSLLASLAPILGLIFALLAMSILIASIGIANTLRLSTLERTKEIGLMRAIGMAKPQVRGMVRWEAIIVSLLGAVLGVVMGIGYGAALVKKSADFRLGIPWPVVPVLVIFAVAIGLLASWRAASQAAKLDMLAAIATQ